MRLDAYSSRWRIFAPWSLIMLLVTCVAACSDEEGPREVVPPAPEGLFASCERNADCAGGFVCRDSFCRAACRVSDDCPQVLPLCDEETSLCAECLSDDRCTLTERCFVGLCYFWCRLDEDCGRNEYCHEPRGECIERDCTTNADCSGGFRCGRTGCEPIE